MWGKPAAGAAIGVIVVMCAPPAHAAGETVDYYISSNGPLMSVSYYDGMNEMTQETDVAAPWHRSFVVQATYGLHSISAQTNGTQVSCEVDVDGQMVDHQTTVGRYTVAVCAG
jgi:hypothetical protein